MPGPTSYTEPALAARLLNAYDLTALLSRHRLISYNSLASELESLYYVMQIQGVWRQVFGEPAPAMGLFDAVVELALKVDLARFPVRTEVLDFYLCDCAENPYISILEAPVPFCGQGVPWETEPFDNLLGYAQPMVAVCWEHLGYSPSSSDFPHIAGFWEENGYTELPRLTWQTSRDWALSYFESLGPPLDGLAGLYLATVKGTCNPFLDTPDPMTGCPWEYPFFDEFFWDAPGIQALTEFYKQALPVIGPLRGYRKWFEFNSEGALPKVLEVLTQAEEIYEHKKHADFFARLP